MSNLSLIATMLPRKCADDDGLLLPFSCESSLLELVRPETRVKVKGLASFGDLAGLNGLRGHITRETVALLGAAGRVEVQTDGGGRCLRLKQFNIEAEYQRPSPSSKAMLKPRWVSATGEDGVATGDRHQRGVDFEVCQVWRKCFVVAAHVWREIANLESMKLHMDRMCGSIIEHN